MEKTGSATSQLTASQYLRFSTRFLHDSLESQVDWKTALSSLAGYCQLLASIRTVQRPVDRILAELLPDEPAERRNASWIDRDLQWAAGRPGAPTVTPDRQDADLSWITEPAQAAGAVYVFEGSTLGAAVLAKQVRENLGATADAGCEYFSAYGDQTVPRWRQTKAWLDERLTTQEQLDAAAQAAQRTFMAYADAVGGRQS